MVRAEAAQRVVAIVPNDNNDLAAPPTIGLYIGTGGDVTLTPNSGGTNVTFKAVPTGRLLPVCPKRVLATGTTATNILALY